MVSVERAADLAGTATIAGGAAAAVTGGGARAAATAGGAAIAGTALREFEPGQRIHAPSVA
ncbi:hypothetical protein ER308_17630 [Egibacter rhizosphaerae]|uniref:Uncharacterized protein n=1 Tax=Egibacter rhizosphaerae TaxID=1670831 RepID=A0A411YJ00_9ACTN|nr:hypothetical protein [Egibacter rhizosphaerae]QBI21210.1 hypothetical protein ER308_17630 [Egibacter rhizosphaerae]